MARHLLDGKTFDTSQAVCVFEGDDGRDAYTLYRAGPAAAPVYVKLDRYGYARVITADEARDLVMFAAGDGVECGKAIDVLAAEFGARFDPL